MTSKAARRIELETKTSLHARAGRSAPNACDNVSAQALIPALVGDPDRFARGAIPTRLPVNGRISGIPILVEVGFKRFDVFCRGRQDFSFGCLVMKMSRF